MFKSVNEINNLSFEDCVFCGLECSEDGFTLELEALIIKANNSQNSNFTDSYAGTSFLKFENGKIIRARKAGYRYYNADGKLMKEVPDEPVEDQEINALLKVLRGSYLVAVEAQENGFLLEIEMADEDGCGNSYLFDVECSGTVVTWERYMNRVQR